MVHLRERLSSRSTILLINIGGNVFLGNDEKPEEIILIFMIDNDKLREKMYLEVRRWRGRRKENQIFPKYFLYC